MVNAQWQYLFNETALSDIGAVQVILWRRGLCAFGYNPAGKVLIIDYRNSERDIDDIALENIILNLPVLAGPQQVTTVWIAESRNILVPGPLFNEAAAADWLSHLHFIEADETALHQHYRDTVLTYPLSIHRQQLLQQYFPEAAIRPLTAMTSEVSPGDKARLVIINDRVLMGIKSGARLLLHEWFRFETAEDIVYKIALLQDTHQLVREDMDIILSGIGGDLVSLSSRIQTYYANTKLIADNEAAVIDFLTNLASCAS